MNEKEIKRKTFKYLQAIEDGMSEEIGMLCENWAVLKMILRWYYWDNKQYLEDEPCQKSL